MKISTILLQILFFLQDDFSGKVFCNSSKDLRAFYSLDKNADEDKVKAMQLSDSLTEKNINPADRFLLRSLALTFANFRDFATSPLFYPGTGFNFGHGWLNSSIKRVHLLELNLSSSFHTAKSPISTYFQTDVRAFLFSLYIYYNYLRMVEKLSNEKTCIKIGTAFWGTQNIRINPHFGNAASGLETIANLNLAINISKKLFQKEKSKTEKKLSKKISFQFDAAVLNFNHRPGYTYVSVGEFGNGLEELTNLIKSYQWSINGWRIGTRLEYCWYNPNGNGRKLIYIWDAANVPGGFEKFQFAAHRIGYSIIINNNKK